MRQWQSEHLKSRHPLQVLPPAVDAIRDVAGNPLVIPTATVIPVMATSSATAVTLTAGGPAAGSAIAGTSPAPSPPDAAILGLQAQDGTASTTPADAVQVGARTPFHAFHAIFLAGDLRKVEHVAYFAYCYMHMLALFLLVQAI